jgi:hypothetical protein
MEKSHKWPNIGKGVTEDPLLEGIRENSSLERGVIADPLMERSPRWPHIGGGHRGPHIGDGS